MQGSAANSQSNATGQQPLVMIVDDDREQANQIATFLSRFGIAVAQEDNGFAAVNTMRRDKPAVVIMDVRMPGLDGIKAAQLAANLDYKPKIILMSGYADQVKRATEEGLDVFAVVDKPLPLRVLVRFVQNALNGQT
ncbi:MAG: response regulator [Alphaproteobacteria bacterium]|jgi:CheY-like chemotaxis protein|nr:response regulator [Alphaproteobacteria bacterium]